jgi:hypothetical protein
MRLGGLTSLEEVDSSHDLRKGISEMYLYKKESKISLRLSVKVAVTYSPAFAVLSAPI